VSLNRPNPQIRLINSIELREQLDRLLRSGI
jgi:hypothetical protein